MDLCKRILALVLVVLLSTPVLSGDFELQEHLGRDWTREYVSFPLDPGQLANVKKQSQLTDQDGKAVVWQQITGDDSKPHIALQTDLAKDTTNSWTFAAGNAKNNPATDLKIEDSKNLIRISNSHTGIAINKRQSKGSGPIAEWMLKSGKWIGGSKIIGTSRVRDWKVELVASGPVMAEIKATLSFGRKGVWETRYRLFANEPVVLIDEKFSVDAKVKMDLLLGENFDPSHLFYRNGKQSKGNKVGKNMVSPIESGKIFLLEPWLHWWEDQRRGSTFSLYKDSGKDLFTVAAREAGVWVDPAITKNKRASAKIKVIKDRRGVHALFPIAHGQRKWMLGAFNKDAVLSILKNEKKQQTQSPLPYQYLIKYGHFPLDQIKDYVLTWQDNAEYPRLLLSRNDVATFKVRPGGYKAKEKVKKPNKNLKKKQKNKKNKNKQKNNKKNALRNKQQLERKEKQRQRKLQQQKLKRQRPAKAHQLNTAIPTFLFTGNADIGKSLTGYVLIELQRAIDLLIEQNGLPFGAAPHHQQFISVVVGVADILMDSGVLDQQTRDRIKAKIAFLAYTVSRPEYWSPERGYAANPNMSTTVSGYRVKLAAFLGNHPMAAQWIAPEMKGLRNKLNKWSDDNGGWLEAPHYAMVAYDDILGMLVIANNSGINDWLYTNPKVKKIIQWIAKISTPPDPRIGGYRHHPAIGNTYVNEPTGEFGLLAYLFVDKDPLFSAEMQWQFNQANRYNSVGIGGSFPAFTGFRDILTNPALPEKAPAYGSEIFPQTGVVLRDKLPSDRETYLHLIAGDNHEHYDYDSGSIVIYGMGRVIADEFGYSGRAPQEEHSMVQYPLGGNFNMQIKEHDFNDQFDYVAGTKGPWTRQIMLVKGQSPTKPSYFVVNDHMKTWGFATWRLWLTAASVNIDGNPIRVVGKDDVDTDIYFISEDEPDAELEEKTVKAGSGMKENWTWGAISTTQFGLTIDDEDSVVKIVVFPRLKDSKPPVFTTIADGEGVKIVHEGGTDYVFLNRKSIDYDEAGIKFEGKAGVVRK